MTTRERGDPAATEPARRTARQVWGEEIWQIVHQAGEAGTPRDQLLEEGGMTTSQFESGKGFIRDLKALAEHEAFLAVRGVYLTSTDTNLCAEYIGWRLRGIDKELRRMRTGVMLPLGDTVHDHLVLDFYQEQISHMLKEIEHLRAVGYPVTVMPGN